MLQNFLKIYPKMLNAQMSNGALIVKLVYAVEQYGLFTGPFEMRVRWEPGCSGQGACWTIVSNTFQRESGAFVAFFKTLEAYLESQSGAHPLEAVFSGKKNSFEMYFPEMHCDIYKDASPKKPASHGKSCGSLWADGLEQALQPLRRSGPRQGAWGVLA